MGRRARWETTEDDPAMQTPRPALHRISQESLRSAHEPTSSAGISLASPDLNTSECSNLQTHARLSPDGTIAGDHHPTRRGIRAPASGLLYREKWKLLLDPRPRSSPSISACGERFARKDSRRTGIWLGTGHLIPHSFCLQYIQDPIHLVCVFRVSRVYHRNPDGPVF
jgi:hypothetical protein